jgi:hypothetical protein
MEVETLDGYVRGIEDDWADVVLKTARGRRIEVWFPLARLKREGLAYPGAAFQYDRLCRRSCTPSLTERTLPPPDEGSSTPSG